MSDFFMSYSDDYWKNKKAEQQKNTEQETPTTSALSKRAKEYNQAKAEHYENWNRYGVEVPDEYYKVFNQIISKAESPEDAQEEAYKIGSAVKYSQMMNIPIEEAYQNVDAWSGAYFPDAQNQKSRYEAVADMWNIGTNNVKLGTLGNQLKKAQRENDTELVNSLMEEINAINQQNVLMQDSAPRTWVMEALKAGAQSAPFTLAVAGAGIIGNFIGAGTGAAMAASSYLSAGQEYIDMIANGASPETARIVSDVSGLVQGLIEADLGITKSIVKAGAKVMGKEAAKNFAEKSLEEIGRKVFKRFHFGSGKKLLLNYLANYGKNILGEGTEEFLQEITSIVGEEVAASLDGYDLPDDDIKSVTRQVTEAFKGGVLGAVGLGIIPGAVNTAADIKTYRAVRTLSEKVESEETFYNAVKDTSLFEGMEESAKKETVRDIWEKGQQRAEEAAREIAETRDAAEGAEETTRITDEGEEETIEVNAPARDEHGQLYTQNKIFSKDGEETGGRFLVGDRTQNAEEGKEGGARYGYINWEYDENDRNKIIITSFNMTEGREGLRGEVYDMFAREHAGSEIEWNPITRDAKAKKSALVENNPAGSKNGLNYYKDIDAVTDEATRRKVAAEVRKNIHNIESYRVKNTDGKYETRYKRTELSNNQLASAVSLLEAAAKAQKMSLSEYVDKTFGTQIFGDVKVLQKAVLAQDKQDIQEGKAPKAKAGGMGWKQYGQQIKAVIYAGENADFSTWTHELAHIFQSQLTGDLKAQAEAAFKVVKGDWINSKYTFKDGHSDSAAEAFAYGFQDWLKTGKAENEEMKNIFQKFAEFVARAFNSLKNFINLTPEIENVYNQLLSGDDSILKAAELAVEKEDRNFRAQQKAKAEAAEKAKKAEAEQQRKTEESEREEISETTDFTETKEELTPEQAEQKLDEVTKDEKKSSPIDDALKNTNLTDAEKTEIADVLKDESNTIVEKAEAVTEAASSAYDTVNGIPADLFFQEVQEVERQMEAVRKQYKGTETWMKAPNGQPTNLTEKQWLQVRTPNFKRFFGNWLYDENKQVEVTEIDTTNLPFDFSDTASLKQWLKDNLAGKSVTIDDDGMVVGLSNRGLKDSVKRRGEEQRAVYTGLEDVLRKAVFFDFEENDGQAKHSALKGQDIYYSAIKAGDKLYSVRIKLDVNKSSLKTSYKDHKLTEIQLEPVTYPAGINNDVPAQSGSNTFNISLLSGAVKPKNSQVLDENGEPLVVYHGSNQWFQVFNEGKTNKSSNVNTPDNTIFTNDNKEIASSFENYYGGNIKDVILDKDSPLHRKYDWGTYRAGGVYSLFMNLRNPKIVDYKGQRWNAEGLNINEEVAKAIQEGYDGFIAKNIIDVGLTDVTPPASNDYIAFNNTAVKSATDNIGNFDANNPNILFQIAGEIGAENLDNSEVQEGVSRMQNLAIAKQMEAEGKEAQVIRLATGWEKGSDGFWKYELDDNKIRLYDEQFYPKRHLAEDVEYDKIEQAIRDADYNLDTIPIQDRQYWEAYNDVESEYVRQFIDFDNGKSYWKQTVDLERIINAPELFKAYPQLKKIQFVMQELPNGVMARWENNKNRITVSPWARKNHLQHEIQHVIQDIEGFAKGGSAAQFETKDYSKEKIDSLTKQAHELFNKQNENWKKLVRKYNEASINQDYETTSQISDELENDAAFNEYVDLISKATSIKEGTTSISYVKTPEEQYRNLAGETEARNIQHRINFTPEQRRNTLLAATEDVAREDQIILFQQVFHGSGADFDEFNTEEYGLSGEGSMSFGYGAYVTNSEEIARDYANRAKQKNSKSFYIEAGQLVKEILEDMKKGISFEESYLNNKDKYIKQAQDYIKNLESNTYFDAEEKENYKNAALASIEQIENLKNEDLAKGNLYTVEIPDDGYLRWDETIPKATRRKIVDGLYNKLIQEDYKGAEKELKYELSPIVETALNGKEIYDNIWTYLGSDKEASQFLHSIGYAGIKYPAGTIYGNGNGSYNYVIFNDEDAKIVDHLFFQTQAELEDEARGFDSWQDFMEFCEIMHSDDEVSPIPSAADAQWYQSFWEMSHGIQTEAEQNEQAVQKEYDSESSRPMAMDALFITSMRNDPDMLDDFLHTVARIEAVDFNSAEWAQVADEEDAAYRDKIAELKAFIGYTLSDYSWGSAIKKIQGGGEITEGHRKRLLGEITDGFKARDFRALYAEVMNDPQFAVAEKDSVSAQLAEKLSTKKYKDILEPGEDISRVSPERRKQIAAEMSNRDIAAKIANGTLKLNDEVDAYFKSLKNQVKEAQKKLDELELETKADYQRIGKAETKDLLKLHEELLLARGKMQANDREIQRKIDKGLKITEKYQKQSQNLKADYNEIFRKFADLKKTIAITAEVQSALDRQEQVAEVKQDLNQKQKDKSLVAEIKKMRIQLVKRTMRRVPFNRIDYENARTVIAIQRMLEPNLLGGVNRFIGVDSAFLRGVISGIVTDSEYRQKILNYLSKTTRASKTFAEFKKKIEELKSIKDFDTWTARERKNAIRYLPKENWVRELNLKQLAKEREESIDLDIETIEKTVMKINPETGLPMTDKEGNKLTETAFSLKYPDEIGRLVKDAVGADMFDLIVNKPFSEWTTEELEQLAQRIDELYTEGRELYAAKREAKRKEADRIRQKIENAIKDTGITINDDDPPEVKEKKLKKINKILGLDRDIKGTEAAKTTGIRAKFDRFIHGYQDANILRVARILDNQTEGENVRQLYRRENDCFNAKQRSMTQRGETVKKIMQANKITEESLMQTVPVKELGTSFTVDELLFFLAADKDYEEDERLVAKGFMGIDANDDYAATSRNAVMFGNMMSDTMSQEEKEEYDRMDKAMEEAIKNDTLTAEQRIQQTLGTLDTRPGTTQYIASCHAKWKFVLGVANSYLNANPQYKALMEAIEADYAEQYERMNRISIEEFNAPVHRVKAYVPLIRRENNGDINVNQVKEDLLGAYSGENKQWVNKGMTQRRVNISPLKQQPVQTGLFRTWCDSVDRTEHFIAYAPYVRQLNAIYKSKDASYSRRFIEARYGKPMLEYIDSYINEVANPNAGKIREKGAEFLHVLRGKTAPAYLGWKFSAVIKQGLTSPWPYMQFVNPAEYFAAATKCWTSGGKVYDAIKEKSAFMNSRVMDPVNELVDELSEQAKNKADRAWSKFTKKGMQGLEWIDWTCVAPGWLACYEKEYNRLQKMSEARYQAKVEELKERNQYEEVGTSAWMDDEKIKNLAQEETMQDIEAEAVQYADDCTRQCQPSSRAADLAPLFKNKSEAMKAFLQFQTSLNVIWQNLRYDIPYAVKQKEYNRIAGTVCGYVLAGVFMNSVMEGVTSGAKDDDKKGLQALRNLIYYSTTQFTDAVPMIGSDITNMLDQFITGKRGFMQSGTDMTPSATKFLAALNRVKSGNWTKAAELTAEGIGLYFGAPVSGVKEIHKLLGKPIDNGKVDIPAGIGDVYGLADDIISEEHKK